jgi:hypothetical protein
MAKQKSSKRSVEVYQGDKLDASTDKSKLTKDMAAPPKDEVGGRSEWVYANCPHCGSLRICWISYEGEGFICGNCGGYFTVYV